ncbi:hypothetical protein V1525DRAFT_415388 [Lipomyces kononenkoae]|uniref:Uncharacterized protein n=1 Tax=Lipomyces kononenkoae TaxID=34357 RepID=A0ACC3SQ45_LIPKO
MSRPALSRVILVILLSIFLHNVAADTSQLFTSIITAPPSGITSIPVSVITDSTPSSIVPSSSHSSAFDAAASISLLNSATLVAESANDLGPLVTADPETTSTIDYAIPKSTATSEVTPSVIVDSSASAVSPTSVQIDSSRPSSSSSPPTSTNASDSSSVTASTTSSSSKRRTTILVAVIVSVAGVLAVFFLILGTVHYHRRRQRKRLSSRSSQSSRDAEATDKPDPSAQVLAPVNGLRPHDKLQEKMEVIKEESADPQVAGLSSFRRPLSRNKTLPLLPLATEPCPPPTRVFGASPRRNLSVDSSAAERHRNAVIMNYSDESLLVNAEVDPVGLAR